MYADTMNAFLTSAPNVVPEYSHSPLRQNVPERPCVIVGREADNWRTLCVRIAAGSLHCTMVVQLLTTVHHTLFSQCNEPSNPPKQRRDASFGTCQFE